MSPSGRTDDEREVIFDVPCADESVLASVYGRGLAEGGIFVRHDAPLPVQTHIRIKFKNPQTGVVVGQVVGEVQFARSAIRPGEHNAGMQIAVQKYDRVALRIAKSIAKEAWHNKEADDATNDVKFFSTLKLRRAVKVESPTAFLGIDLGTVNTCVAAVIEGAPRVIATPEGHETFPSILYVRDDGKFLVGHKAEPKIVVEPQNTIYGSKRFLGRKFASREVNSLAHFFNYELVAGREGRAAAVVAGKQIPLEKVSGLFLLAARRMAEEALQREVGGAVITVPAYFGIDQRAAVREAATAAGLRVGRLVNEPTAAAVALSFHRHLDCTVLIYDLGGGTFDASLVKIAGDNFEVLASAGDPFLGGQDFDDRLVQYVVSEFERANNDGGTLRKNPASLQRVRIAVQAAKHALTEATATTIELPYISMTDKRHLDLKQKVTRKLFESLTEDLVNRTLEVVESIMASAKLRSAEIGEVVLVGGQSRSPAVRKALASRFERKLSTVMHRDHAVALGAALVAQSLAR